MQGSIDIYGAILSLHNVSCMSPLNSAQCGLFRAQRVLLFVASCQEDSGVIYIMYLNIIAHGAPAPCASSSPETWPVTLTWGINWAADIFRSRLLSCFWKTWPTHGHHTELRSGTRDMEGAP